MNYESNPSFSAHIPKLQLAWDSTSMGAFKTCPRLYEYTIVYGYTPRATPVHLTFGLLYHAALETYDRAKAAGADHELALDNAVEYTLKATWDTKLQRPWQSDDSNKNRYTLLRTIVWYLDEFKDDPISTVILANSKPAVELSFQLETDYIALTTGERFTLCGHLDRLGEFQNNHYVVDKKTSKSTLSQDTFAHYSPDNQMSTYAYAGQIVLGQPIAGIIIDAAQIAVTFSAFERGLVERRPEQLDEWYKDLGHWLKLAEHYAKLDYWPQNDKACGMYGGCPFRLVCGKAPSVRQLWLDKAYVKREWNPLAVRGDI